MQAKEPNLSSHPTLFAALQGFGWQLSGSEINKPWRFTTSTWKKRKSWCKIRKQTFVTIAIEYRNTFNQPSKHLLSLSLFTFADWRFLLLGTLKIFLHSENSVKNKNTLDFVHLFIVLPFSWHHINTCPKYIVCNLAQVQRWTVKRFSWALSNIVQFLFNTSVFLWNHKYRLFKTLTYYLKAVQTDQYCWQRLNIK